MSQENVEILRRGNDAFNRGDMAAFAEFMAPNIVYYERHAYLDTPPVMHGRDACVRAVSEFASAFEDFRAVIEDLLDAGEWVVTLNYWQGSGAGSGASVDLREVIAWRFQDGLAIEGRVFATWDEALEAVGLPRR